MGRCCNQKVNNGDPTPAGAVRDGSLVECRCKRCRTRWVEIEGTRHTEGLGSLRMCPKCFAEAIDRVRYYKVPNGLISRAHDAAG